jgi:hypothetical protein
MCQCTFTISLKAIFLLFAIGFALKQIVLFTYSVFVNDFFEMNLKLAFNQLIDFQF